MISLKNFKPGTRNFYVLLAIVATVVFIVFMLARQKKENFSFGSIFGKVKDVAVGVGQTYKQAGQQLYDQVKQNMPQAYSPQWTYRQWNGKTWSCPAGTYDYGGQDEKQCLVGSGPTGYAPQRWRWDGTTWGWSCPNNSTLTPEGQWEKKCIFGATGRQLIDGTWKCNNTQTDTGFNWDNTDWFNGGRQCSLGDGWNTVFTTRVFKDGKWTCPANTTDTGYNWGSKSSSGEDRGFAQCQYIGG
jgi:hypothetical protein